MDIFLSKSLERMFAHWAVTETSQYYMLIETQKG